MSETRIYQARFVFPVVSPPIERGQVAVAGGKVVAVGTQLGDEVIDLGDVALLPAFVNAHTHLEFSGLTKPVGEIGNSITDWIPHVIEARRNHPLLQDRFACLNAGVEESLRQGVGVIADIVNVPFDPTCFTKPGLAAVLFRELIGLNGQLLEERLDDAAEHLNGDLASQVAGISPHAPYTVHPRLLEEICQRSSREHFPVAMHIAESLEELELIQSHSGPFVDFLTSLDAWDPTAIGRGMEIMDYLELLSKADRALIVHGNYLIPSELEFIATHKHLSVVYCPRTHAFFGHNEYPLQEMLIAGVRVAIGTDSRASNPDLSILQELKFLFSRCVVEPASLLQFGTLNGAEALGLANRGAIEAGRDAVFATVAIPTDEFDPYNALLGDKSHVLRLLKV